MPNFPPIALASLLIALAASPCSAQFGRSSDAFGSGGMFPNSAKQTAPAAGDLVRKPKQDPLPQLPNAPIIREGVFFSSVKGYFAPSLREPGLLTFRVDERRTASTRRYLTVFPCDAAEDIKAILADPRADSPSLFEVTGDVYEMHGRAYLLPIAVVALRAPDAPGMIARNEPKELQRAMARAQGPRAPRIDAYADLSAAELEATPTREAPADRRAHEPNPAVFPGLDDGFADAIERQLNAGIASSGMGTAVKRESAKFERKLLMAQATRFQERRATVLRDPITGVWRAHFNTARPGNGAEDGSEISMEILPSKTLQQLEKQIRQRPVGTAWQLSGEVVVSKDRNYLVLSRAVAHPTDKFISP